MNKPYRDVLIEEGMPEELKWDIEGLFSSAHKVLVRLKPEHLAILLSIPFEKRMKDYCEASIIDDPYERVKFYLLMHKALKIAKEEEKNEKEE